MSNPTDPVVADAQTNNIEKVDLPANASEPSVPAENIPAEAETTSTAENSGASPTAAAVEINTVAPPPSTANAVDAVDPVPSVPGPVTAEQGPQAPVKTPFTSPLPASQPGERAPLTADQEAKYTFLLSAVSAWTSVPTTSAKNAPTEPIADEERMWLTRECLLRYLRAVKWNTTEAQKRLLGTLTWRREYGADTATPDYISPENETGKQVILGYDNASRPCLYLSPSKQNTQRSPKQIQHLVFMLDRVIDLMLPGQETLSLLVNFTESSGGSNPNVAQGRQALSILQTHYPERLGRALVINVPWAVWGFFKIITPFIDPLTREKLKFNQDLRQHVPPQHLLSGFGGDVEFEYDHSIYWPALIKLAEERRAECRERWVKGGKRVGEYEGYLRGGNDKGLSEEEAGQQVTPVPVDDEKVPEVIPAIETLKVQP
ncbi:hypothetical protein FGG08_000280 [Glutinoglossum americanum]|uniref:CRAL-TRIO domain-containing protein n=1 Tax=Glutinoglossum americanum TaxID=1670608 RepID=A0A9P8IFQ0_9PEZI|nr:hypothetical protein FGG08_000280 [Glutinoglossum americanum]